MKFNDPIDGCEAERCTNLGFTTCAYCFRLMCRVHCVILVGKLDEKSQYLCKECDADRARDVALPGD